MVSVNHEKMYKELVGFIKKCEEQISKENDNYLYMDDYERTIVQGQECLIDDIIEKIEEIERLT